MTYDVVGENSETLYSPELIVLPNESGETYVGDDSPFGNEGDGVTMIVTVTENADGARAKATITRQRDGEIIQEEERLVTIQ